MQTIWRISEILSHSRKFKCSRPFESLARLRNLTISRCNTISSILKQMVPPESADWARFNGILKGAGNNFNHLKQGRIWLTNLIKIEKTETGYFAYIAKLRKLMHILKKYLKKALQNQRKEILKVDMCTTIQNGGRNHFCDVSGGSSISVNYLFWALGFHNIS